MDFPLLIKTDQPIQLLGLEPQHQIFFSPQTDLSDLLGQYRPVGNDFVWQDEPLLRSVKEGGMIALIDLNMAQQQVVEGINSLFDHRGSLFVVQLNQTFHKASTFKPVIVLRSEGKGRKGLPNSFLNRFVKLSIKDVNVNVKISYLTKKYPTLANFGQLIQILSNIITTTNTPIHHLELITELGLKGHWREAL